MDKSEYNENSNFYAHMALRNERHVQGAFVGIPQNSRKNALRAGILPILFFTMDLKYGYRNPTGFRQWVVHVNNRNQRTCIG